MRWTYFNDGERCTVGCQDVDQLGLELLLHELGQVALRAQKDLQLFRLGEIAQRSALLQEKIEEVPALTDHCIVLFSAWGHCGLFGHGWDVEPGEAIAEHCAEVIEVLESPLALDISQRVPAHDWIRVMLSQPALDDRGLTNMQLNLAIVAWNVDGLVSVLPSSGSCCCILGAWLVTSWNK